MPERGALLWEDAPFFVSLFPTSSDLALLGRLPLTAARGRLTFSACAENQAAMKKNKQLRNKGSLPQFPASPWRGGCQPSKARMTDGGIFGEKPPLRHSSLWSKCHLPHRGEGFWPVAFRNFIVPRCKHTTNQRGRFSMVSTGSCKKRYLKTVAAFHINSPLRTVPVG